MPEAVKESAGAANLPRANEGAAVSAASNFADFATEKAVLAAILVEPSCLDTVATVLGGFSITDEPKKKGKASSAADSVKGAFHQVANIMFRDPKYAAIYEAMLELKAKDTGIDALSLGDYLKRAGRLDVIGGMEMLLDIQNSIASTANLETWCATLRDYAMLREMIKTCTYALDMCRNSNEDVKVLLESVESEIFKVRNNFVQPEIRDIKTLIKDTFDSLRAIIDGKVTPGIPTGYAGLDRLTGGGLKPGEMFVLAARPSIGKTALALNITRNIVMKNGGGEHCVAFFSLEMSAEQVAQRLLCTEARIPLSTILDGSFRQHGEITNLTAAVASLKKANLYIDPTGGISIFELRSKARKMKETHGIDLIVVDYLQLMKSGEAAKDGRQVEVASISGGLKKLAKDLNVPVLVLAQLNREVEKTAGKNAMPKLSNLRESGAIEQDADVVVFLHRNRDDSKDASAKESGQFGGVEAKLIVEKNRNGRTGIVDLRFHPALMEFRAVDHTYGESDIPSGTKR